MDCDLCHEKIDEKRDYVHVETWTNKRITKEIWAHQVCFNKAMNRELTDLEKQAKAMLERADGMLNMLPQPTKEYQIA